MFCVAEQTTALYRHIAMLLLIQLGIDFMA
jgi:hypothetical protein